MNIDNFQWLIGPIVGAIIGLITNGIAIRMLFRPLYPVKIGKFTLPFTPGLIPKEKPRLAHSIGQVVANQLVNAEVLEKGLLNKDIDDKIIYYVDKFLSKYKNSPDTVKELLLKYFSEDKVEYYTQLTEVKITEVAYQKAVSMDIGNLAMNAVNKEFNRKLNEDPLQVQFMPMLVSLVEPKVVEMINDTIEKQGFEIIYNFITKEGDSLINYPVKDIYKNGQKYIPKLNQSILDLYHFAVKNYLPNVLKEIDLSKLVEDRINDFSLIELEKMLLDLMKKELNAIVYLGGLLGLIMGFIMDLV